MNKEWYIQNVTKLPVLMKWSLDHDHVCVCVLRGHHKMQPSRHYVFLMETCNTIYEVVSPQIQFKSNCQIQLCRTFRELRNLEMNYTLKELQRTSSVWWQPLTTYTVPYLERIGSKRHSQRELCQLMNGSDGRVRNLPFSLHSPPSAPPSLSA